MQTTRAFFLAAVLAAAGSCVQKTQERTVHYRLHVSGIKVETAGITGGDEPLDWDEPLALTPVIPDSLYTATVTYHTGYRFTRVMFLVNGDKGLDGGERRRVDFVEGDSTVVDVTFHSRKP